MLGTTAGHHDAAGELTIAFNGEIYNFIDLRNDLAARGHAFRTDSDTEVILAAYREWGDDCLSRLNGMFAFALHDARRARVLRVGNGTRVEGRKLIEALAREDHRNIALIGGGEILETLIVDDSLDRLYMTLACRVLGGLSFDTLMTGPALEQVSGSRRCTTTQRAPRNLTSSNCLRSPIELDADGRTHDFHVNSIAMTVPFWGARA